MKPFKISVILPVFKVEKYLDASLRSLQAQTIGFDTLQVIYVEDGSPDASGQMIDAYQEKYPNVIALHTGSDSGSAGRPRNVGLQAAAADLVMFLDPDDLYDPNACEALYRAIEGTDCDYVGGYYTETHLGADGKSYNTVRRYFPYATRFLLPSDLSAALPMRVGFWAKIYRRSFLEDNRICFPEKILGEDMVFACQALLCARSIRYIEENIVFYRIRDKEDRSASFEVTPRLLKGIGETYRLITEMFLEKKQLEVLDSILRDVPDYYFKQIQEEGSLQQGDYLTLLQDWAWIFDYLDRRGVSFDFPLSRQVAEYVKAGALEAAAAYMKAQSDSDSAIIRENLRLRKEIARLKKELAQQEKKGLEAQRLLKRLGLQLAAWMDENQSGSVAADEG